MASILLVVGDKAALTADDTLVRNRLTTTLGHTVTLASDVDADASAGKDAIVLTASVDTSELSTKYKNSALPILACQGGSINMWPNLGLCTSTGANSTSTWNVTGTGNPLLGGKTGSFFPFTTSAMPSRFTETLIAGAVDLAVVGSAASGKHTFFDVPAGTTLADGTSTAAGRRIGLNYNDGNLTAQPSVDWWNLFDNSISAIAVVSLSVNVTATQTKIYSGQTTGLSITASNVTGTPTYAWSKVSGPAGTFSNTNTASTVFTPSATGTFVLRGSVTDTSGTKYKDITITVAEAVSATWTVLPASGNAPLTVVASVTVTGGFPPYTYSYNWGDGSTTGSTNNEQHVYVQPGNYSPTCDVTDSQ